MGLNQGRHCGPGNHNPHLGQKALLPRLFVGAVNAKAEQHQKINDRQGGDEDLIRGSLWSLRALQALIAGFERVERPRRSEINWEKRCVQLQVVSPHQFRS